MEEMATAKKSRSNGQGNADVSYRTPALDKGLDVLELLACQRDGLTKSEIARSLGRTISEIFRMLLCLERRGYIAHAAGDRYVLSLRLFRLVQEHPPTERLLAEALPRMHNLADQVQQSCHLGVLEGGRVVILAQANAQDPVGLFVKPGSTVDLMEAASGQVILAHLSREGREKVLEEWRKQSGRRIPSDLSRHLDRIHRRGHEKRASYQVRGVTNISFPICDSVGRGVAAITVPFIQRLPGEIGITKVEKVLSATARAISEAIGAL